MGLRSYRYPAAANSFFLYASKNMGVVTEFSLYKNEPQCWLVINFINIQYLVLNTNKIKYFFFRKRSALLFVKIIFKSIVGPH